MKSVVHESVYIDDRGRAVSDWLTHSGARQIAVVGASRVFALR